MGNISEEAASREEAATRALALCLKSQPLPPDLIDRLAQDECSAALFSHLVEPLADRFEPRLCLAYAELFSEIAARVLDEEEQAPALFSRYLRIRSTTPAIPRGIRKVFVLSRVTLGADIAITSILLEAAKLRFPDAAIYLVGGSKSAELFAADSHVRHQAVPYPRAGTTRERIRQSLRLQQVLNAPDSLVIDPDSRLTQLGIIPVCDESRYLFFETRAYGGEGGADVSSLTREWIANTLGIDNQIPASFSALPVVLTVKRRCATVSLGVGGNENKRIDGDFESKLLALLGKLCQSICIDKGAGGEEAERVDLAVAQSGIDQSRMHFATGSFAAFASMISQSDLYAGYDSAGQHAAASAGVPALTVFRGFAALRTFERWRPTGPGPIQTLRVTNESANEVLEQAEAALHRLMP